MLYTSEYNPSVISSCFEDLTYIIRKVSEEESVPNRIVECCIVGGLIPLYLPRWLFYEICNQVSIGYTEGLGSKILNRLAQQGLIQNQEYLYCRRELLYTVGNLNPSLRETELFKSTIKYLLSTIKSPVDKKYLHNSYIIHYYNDKQIFIDIVNDILEKQDAYSMLLISYSLRNLLDLESTSSNIRYLERLYLVIQKHKTLEQTLKENLISIISSYDEENLNIND